MASVNVIKTLSEVVGRLLSLDEAKLFRTNLGDESLKDELEPLLIDIKNKAELAQKFGKHLPDSILNTISALFNQIANELTAQQNRQNNEFINYKPTLINNINSHLEELKGYWLYVLAAQLEASGLLDESQDVNIEKQKSDAIEKLQEQAGIMIKAVQESTETSIQKAQDLAKEIERKAEETAQEVELKARRTAEKVSVKEAQIIFSKAVWPLFGWVMFWGAVSIALLCFLFKLVEMFILIEDLPRYWSWQIIYFTSVRIALLAFMGSIAVYCLRMFKSQFYLYQYNIHRRNIANCIEAFVVAGELPETRDKVLLHLVDTVTAFGDSAANSKMSEMGTSMNIDGLMPKVSVPVKTG